MNIGIKTEAVGGPTKAEEGEGGEVEEDKVMSDTEDQKPTIVASDTAVKVERDEG